MFGAYAPGEPYFGQAPIGPLFVPPVVFPLDLCEALVEDLTPQRRVASMNRARAVENRNPVRRVQDICL